MKRRCHRAITLATLALQLLAPVGAYAAVVPAAGSGDYCSAVVRAAFASGARVVLPLRAAAADSGVPAPRHSHHSLAHCPSCIGASPALAIRPSTTTCVVRLLVLAAVPVGSVRVDSASSPFLLPPLRGPPSVLL